MKKQTFISLASFILIIFYVVYFFLTVTTQTNETNLNFQVLIFAFFIAFGVIRSVDGLKDEVLLLKENILIFPCVLFGAFATYQLALMLNISTVLTASIIGLIGSIKISRIDKLIPLKDVYIYCGAFIGMSRAEVITSSFHLVIACLFAGILLALLQNQFKGYGGKLGMIAFVSVTSVTLITQVFT